MSKSVISRDYMGKVLEIRQDSLLFARYAYELLMSRRKDDALRIAEQGVIRSPNYACGRFVLALCFIEHRDYEQAMTHLAELLKIEPTHQAGLSKLAHPLDSNGDSEKSQAVADFLFRHNPKTHLLAKFSPKSNGTTSVYELLGNQSDWEMYASDGYENRRKSADSY